VPLLIRLWRDYEGKLIVIDDFCCLRKTLQTEVACLCLLYVIFPARFYSFVLTFGTNLNFALQCDMFSFDLYGCHRLPPQMSLRYFKFNLETYNGTNGERCDFLQSMFTQFKHFIVFRSMLCVFSLNSNSDSIFVLYGIDLIIYE